VRCTCACHRRSYIRCSERSRPQAVSGRPSSFGRRTRSPSAGRIADTTLIDLAAGGTPVDLEFAYTLSAQAKLVLTAHEVYLPKPKLAVEGPGGVQASFDFRGAKNDIAGRMLTVTLTNDLDGSVYT
jgi:hypothetical protein